MDLFQLFKKIRFGLYSTLIFLFLFDFFTTIIGIEHGLVETNERLALFLDNPASHLAIKMIFCFAWIGFQEYIFRRDSKAENFEKKVYGLFIFFTSAVIFIFIWIVMNNLSLINTC